MELDEFVDKQVADCRRFYELGDYRQLITAFRWCTMYDRPLNAMAAQATVQGGQLGSEIAMQRFGRQRQRSARG